MYKWFGDKVKYANVNNFTSNLGLKIRKKNHKIMSTFVSWIFKKIYKKNVIIDRNVKLDKDKIYIFASSHNYAYEIGAIAFSIDRNSYLLFGGECLLYNDFRIFIAWINGLIFVDRFDKKSRKDSVDKMKRVLDAGNSILIFPEGRLNDSENKLCLKMFSGVYNLSSYKKVEVVPMSVFNDNLSNDFHISYGDPIKVYEYEYRDGVEKIRDSIATMMYEQIEKFSSPFSREDIDDIHFNFMEERINEYRKVKWGNDIKWELELFDYKSGDVDLEDVWKDIDKVDINVKNAHIFGDILVELERRKKYDFKNYVIKNFDNNNKK